VYVVGFEVVTAVVIKNSFFLDITPCSPLKVNCSFGRTRRLHLQGRRINQARNQLEEGNKQVALLVICFTLYCYKSVFGLMPVGFK
jgi:hypothetical protein